MALGKGQAGVSVTPATRDICVTSARTKAITSRTRTILISHVKVSGISTLYLYLLYTWLSLYDQ